MYLFRRFIVIDIFLYTLVYEIKVSIIVCVIYFCKYKIVGKNEKYI